MKSYAYLALCILSQLARAEPIELAGVLSSREERALVVLTDKADGGVSPWLSEGEMWRGYRVATIAVAEDAVVLAKDGISTTLRLRDSKVKKDETSAANSIRVLKGKATKVGDRMTYSPDAVVQVGSYKVVARAGSMESEGAWIIGDLTVEAGNGAKLSAASVGVNGGRVRISANKLTLPSPPPEFESKKR